MSNYLRALQTKHSDSRSYYECIEPAWYRKYYFFAETEDSKNMYAIKTLWVVYHDNLIKKSLINSGVHLFESNPLEKCKYIQNKDYEWKKDTVLYKGNRSDTLNLVAFNATKTSFSVEWALIFIWLWGPFVLLSIISLFDLMKKKFKSYAEKRARSHVMILTPK
jgi:hypothetical protein